MSSVLLPTGDQGVTLTGQAVQRLIDSGSGDAALLYLALLRRQGAAPPRSLAGELRWDRPRIEAAETVLRDLGLIAPGAESIPEPAEEHPAYRQTEIAGRLEGSGEFRRLTDEVERKLGKKLTVADIGVLLGLNDYLGLPADVIYLLVCHCTEQIRRRYGEGRRPGMRLIEKEGYAWARMGIDSQAAAADYLRRYALRQERIPQYMRLLGLGERMASPSEEKYLSAWQDMGFPPETVALAYDRTVLKCGELKWAYLNGILRRWHAAGLHTPEEVAQGDRPAARSGSAGKPPAKGGGKGAWEYV